MLRFLAGLSIFHFSFVCPHRKICQFITSNIEYRTLVDQKSRAHLFECFPLHKYWKVNMPFRSDTQQKTNLKWKKKSHASLIILLSLLLCLSRSFFWLLTFRKVWCAILKQFNQIFGIQFGFKPLSYVPMSRIYVDISDLCYWERCHINIRFVWMLLTTNMSM